MAYFYPNSYILDIKPVEDAPDLMARVDQIIERCEAKSAKQKTNEEAKQEIRGLSATERYDLGKVTLHIKEIKRSSVHFFNTPKGAIESPQLVINHGMICPHSCQYCYWQKDLLYSSRIVVYANSKERFAADIINAVAIWRVFSAFLQAPSCIDKVDDKLFVRFDHRLRKETKDTDSGDLNGLCADLALEMLNKWKVPKQDREIVQTHIL